MPKRLRPSAILLLAIVACFRAGLAQAQQPGGSSAADTTNADRHDVISDKQHHFLGKVEMHRGDTTLYADEVWYYPDEDRAVATGNVLFRQGSNQISADRADFTLNTHLGTFYNASGFASIQPMRQTPRPGAVAPPPMAGQESVVYFFGETVEKLGPRKYKIVDGGFTTCVQPTPRWDLHADTVILNVDHYTFLRNTIMTVKGVPMLYLPVLYYPTKKGDRATGFLLPTYGSSTLRGQTISNAFFWAIDRSQDATIAYDWFSQAGQGIGSEYRYNFGGGNDGTIRSYILNQHENTFAGGDGSTSTLPAVQSYELHGSASQTLPYHLRARARIDYFSSFTTMQTFNTNLNSASQSQRSFGGNVVGSWGSYSLNSTFDHTEYFYNQSSSAVSGGWPRIGLSRYERPIPGTPLYLSANGEFVHILSDRKDETSGTLIESDLGLTRFDVAPQIRFPFKKWQWFTVNSTASWRDTYYTRSYDPATIDPVTNQGTTVIDSGLNRQFFTVGSQITGPVFNRIWDTPDNKYAEKFKHSIEPTLMVQRTSSIDNYNQIVKLEGIDQIVGGATQYTYGITNRFYAKRRSTVPGRPSLAREIVTVDLQQTYYTDDRAAQIDRQYLTSNSGAPPSHFSPLALNVRAAPADNFNATLRAEFDSTYKALRTISVGGQYAWNQLVQTSVNWSKRNFIPELVGFNDPAFLDQSISATTNVHTRDNKYGSIYSFNYDVLHSTLLQQRVTGFYNAQCCGIAFEYQTYNFLSSSISPIPSDHRFFLSFTLAGLGNFSPFNGALGGVPR